MKTLVFVSVIAIFIVLGTTGASASVIGGDLDNAVAVYYFSSLTNSGHVFDYSGNGLHGDLFDGARLRRISGRNCLSLGSNRANFQAWDDNKPLLVFKEFSIVAWVRIPRQSNDFLIQIYAYNGPIANIWDQVSVSEGRVYLGILSSGDLFGGYIYEFNIVGSAAAALESTDRRVNNNRWQHIGFVVNDTSTKLYLNGTRIAHETISSHESFAGTGSIVFIGEDARGSVDDVGLFKNELTDAQVRLIYNQGLANIISIASVDPRGKAATTWGALKQK